MRPGPALQKGPNALQQDGRRTESGASSSLQLLACGISGPVQCSAARTCVAPAVLLLCGVGKVDDTVCQCAGRDLQGTLEESSRRALWKSALESTARGGRCVLLTGGANCPPEQLTLGRVGHGKAEASPHPGR